MAAGSYSFTIEQGATFDVLITWRDGNGDPKNVTGYQARMQLRTTITSPTITLELTDENGRIVLGGTAGTIQLLIAATDTAALGEGSYVYDLELESGAGVVTRLLKGSITVDPEVTR